MISACMLHDMLRNSSIPYPNEQPRCTPELPKKSIMSFPPTAGNTRATFEASRVRETFRAYFNSPHGRIPCQEDSLSRSD